MVLPLVAPALTLVPGMGGGVSIPDPTPMDPETRGTAEAEDVRIGCPGCGFCTVRVALPFTSGCTGDGLISPPMGISPDVGVLGPNVSLDEAESSPLSRARVDGDGCGARCDFRFFLSIIEIAQASRSTGVRLAAFRKGSLSCRDD